MAKKASKKKTENEDAEDVVDGAEGKSSIATLDVDLSDVMFDANFLIERKRPIVSVSPGLDLILGGGVPFGSFVIPTGPPKVGKTTFALQLAGSALGVPKTHDNERQVFIFNIEGRLKRRDLLGISKLVPYLRIPDKVKIIESSPGKILPGEKYLEIGEQLINEKPGCIFIFDSFSMLCSSARRSAQMGESFRDNMPLVMADFCKKISNVIPVNDSIVIGITHRYANTSGKGNTLWSEASGTKVQYQVDVKMKATHAEPWKSGDRQIGQYVNWEVGCSALGPPGGKFASCLRYGYGIDDGAELVDLASQIGLIKKGGAGWYTFKDDIKVQGQDKASQYLNENPDLYKEIYAQYREVMGFDADT